MHRNHVKAGEADGARLLLLQQVLEGLETVAVYRCFLIVLRGGGFLHFLPDLICQAL